MKTVLFGYPINSRIGIPACLIMTSSGIAWAAKAGYDVLTYKTIRSRAFSGHSFPYMFLLENPGRDFSGNQMTTMIESVPSKIDSFTMANSIGTHSNSLDWVTQDIAKARASLSEGQVLNVSIIGDDLADFGFLASAVVEAGAYCIEANLSCPNLHSPLATYKDPIAVSEITRTIYKAIPHIPIILKVGLFDSYIQMKEVFKTAAIAGAKGICGINTLPMQIVDREGNPAFGKERKIAGVSGEFIRPKAYDFVVNARRIIQEESLDLTLLATGGIMKPEHFDLFLDAGANVAMSATGAMWNPNLAAEFHARKS
jgi:dihydroorotate dehydrogenase (NAD+) catalytic subunit